MRIIFMCLALVAATWAAPLNEIDDASEFKSKAIFDFIAEKLEAGGPALVKKFNGVYAFNLKNAAGKEAVWIVDAKNGAGSVQLGGTTKPNVSFTLSDDDFVDMTTGKLNPQRAMLKKKLKIKGNVGLAFKLQKLLQ